MTRSRLLEAAGSHAVGWRDRLRVERFEPLRRNDSPGLLGLSVRMPFVLGAAASPALVIEHESGERVVLPQLASTCRVADADVETWLWRGVFAVPPTLVGDPVTEFALRLYGGRALRLPPPLAAEATAGQAVSAPRPSRTWPYGVRRGALVIVVTCQLLLMPGWVAAGALADGSSTTATSSETTPESPPPQPPAPVEGAAEETPTQPPPGEQPPEPTPPPAEPPSEPPKQEPPNEAPEETPPAAPTESPGPPSAADANSPNPVQGGGAQTTSTASTPVLAASTRPRASRDQQPRPDVTIGLSHRQPTTPGRNAAHVHTSRVADSGSRVSTRFAPPPGLVEIPADLTSLTNGLPGGVEEGPPAFLIPIYKAAGRRYDVPWRVLAAINQIETHYGRDLSVSSAGAMGWMQFMPATWAQWGVDADHDGHADPYSPVDAVFAAARYLHASGAARDLAGAVFSYNHADWYVAEVLLRARMLRSTATFARVENGYALPLDARFLHELGRTDDGVDIETAPNGALVYSITPGIVTAVASDPGGFGPDYPVIEATAGALTGRDIYYGHVAASLVAPGAHVAAGEPIAIIGHSGDAASLGHGHIEIGFSDASGDPLSHHGAEAATPAGAAMRGILVGLSGEFGVLNQ
jgi:murein DD-endopeptidase MepM/ murein hydrolase activator NlpD